MDGNHLPLIKPTVRLGIIYMILNSNSMALQVNDMEMKGVTREEAVLFLLSLQERIDLIVQHSPDEYNAVASGQMRKFFF